MSARAFLAMYRQRDRLIGPLPEPQWRMLCDLAVNGSASVTSLCIASGSAPTTALRHIGVLEQDGFIIRTDDPDDRRRHFLALADKARGLLARLEAVEA